MLVSEISWSFSFNFLRIKIVKICRISGNALLKSVTSKKADGLLFKKLNSLVSLMNLLIIFVTSLIFLQYILLRRKALCCFARRVTRSFIYQFGYYQNHQREATNNWLQLMLMFVLNYIDCIIFCLSLLKTVLIY